MKIHIMQRPASCLFVLLLSMATTLMAQPKITLPGGDIHDWGDVKSGTDSVTALVEIHNLGDKPLIIDQVKTSCGCTAAIPENDTIIVGGSTKLRVAMNIHNKSGSISKKISIYSNDPVNPVVALDVKTTVIVPVMAEPKYFVFDKLKLGEKTHSSLLLKNTTDEVILLTDATAPPHTKVELETPLSLEPGQEVEVRISSTPPKPGYFNTFVTIKSSHPDLPIIRLKGYGNAVSEDDGK